jgi:hypothetical protein
MAESRPSQLKGWACLGIAGLAAYLTVDHWVKALPGIFAMAVVAVSLAFERGYVGPDPANSMTRSSAAVFIAVYTACTGLSVTLQSRHLSSIDRAALLGCAASFMFAAASDAESKIGAYLMVACLAVAWVNGMMQRRIGKNEGKSGTVYDI